MGSHGARDVVSTTTGLDTPLCPRTNLYLMWDCGHFVLLEGLIWIGVIYCMLIKLLDPIVLLAIQDKRVRSLLGLSQNAGTGCAPDQDS